MSAPGPTPNDVPRPHGVEDEERSSTYSAARRQTELAETVVPTADESRLGNRAETPLPSAFGRYRVTRLIGRGGMGSVYLGYDDQLDRAVAIKVPHPELFQSKEGRENFLREARTLAKLDHPRIIPVYDAGETENGLCYVVCRYVDGQTLKERMRDTRMAPREASNVLAEVADALHHAHKQGFVHRDIKPSNILIDRKGNAWVADFGLAVAESAQRRFAGEVSGTPAYMTPEQTRGDVQYLDGRADIWSMGVILYELLAGRRPFSGASVDEVFAEIAQKEPRPLRMIDETIPQSLERIVLKCLRKPVAERYTSAHDLARDLRTWGRKRARSRTMVVVVLASAMSIAAVLAIPPLLNRQGTDGLVTSDDRPRADLATNTETSELSLLIEELRGLRKDLGESNSRIDEISRRQDPVETVPDEIGPLAIRSSVEPENNPAAVVPGPVETVDVPPPTPALTEWNHPPLPAEFAELEVQLHSAWEAGDREAEDGLLLQVTNDLTAAGYNDLAEYFAYRMIELADNDPGDAPIAYGQLGLAQSRLGKFDEALTSYHTALEQYESLYDRMMAFPESEQLLEFRSSLARLVGLTRMRIGNVHKSADQYQLAHDAYESAKEILEAHDRQNELILLLLNYGGLESEHGQYEHAIQLLQEGLTIAQSTGAAQEEAELLVNLGNAYSRSGDNGIAIQNYELAGDKVTVESSYPLRSALFCNWSTSLLEVGEHEQARQLLLELQSFVHPDDVDSQRVLEVLPALDRALEP